MIFWGKQFLSFCKVLQLFNSPVLTLRMMYSQTLNRKGNGREYREPSRSCTLMFQVCFLLTPPSDSKTMQHFVIVTGQQDHSHYPKTAQS